MLRSIAGVLLGLLLAVIVIVLVELVGHYVYPPPEGLDPRNPEHLRVMMERAPPGALGFVIAAWGLGTLAGSWLAAWTARRARLLHASIIGAVFLAAAIFTMVSIPHPGWFQAAGIAVFPVAALAGALLARPKSRPTDHAAA